MSKLLILAPNEGLIMDKLVAETTSKTSKT